MPTMDASKRLEAILSRVEKTPQATPRQRAQMARILEDERQTLELLVRRHKEMQAVALPEDGPLAGCGMTAATLQALDLSSRQFELLVSVAVMMLAERDAG